jgi:hypothetical protein
MAQLGEDVRLVEAQRKAVQETLKELEYHAASRIRREGANDDRTLGGPYVLTSASTRAKHDLAKLGDARAPFLDPEVGEPHIRGADFTAWALSA